MSEQVFVFTVQLAMDPQKWADDFGLDDASREAVRRDLRSFIDQYLGGSESLKAHVSAVKVS